eukprot:scaffold5664_cov115-Isochrysis_galbana.AAC.29
MRGGDGSGAHGRFARRDPGWRAARGAAVRGPRRRPMQYSRGIRERSRQPPPTPATPAHSLAGVAEVSRLDSLEERVPHPNHQHISEHAQRPQINLPAVTDARQQLRCAVGRRAALGRQPSCLACRQAKVGQLDGRVGGRVGEHDVRRLDVTVGDGLLVQVVDGRDYLRRRVEGRGTVRRRLGA